MFTVTRNECWVLRSCSLLFVTLYLNAKHTTESVVWVISAFEEIFHFSRDMIDGFYLDWAGFIIWQLGWPQQG